MKKKRSEEEKIEERTYIKNEKKLIKCDNPFINAGGVAWYALFRALLPIQLRAEAVMTAFHSPYKTLDQFVVITPCGRVFTVLDYEHRFQT